MKAINIEIKAKSTKSKNDEIRSILLEKGAISLGVKHQVDTYFKTEKGRLKLREYDDDMCLIFYDRDNIKGLKQSRFVTYEAIKDESLKSILSLSYTVWKIVNKQREIFSIDNIRIHLDDVKNLGVFMEIEVVDHDGTVGIEKLTKQCEEYLECLGINKDDLLEGSYSDMITN